MDVCSICHVALTHESPLGALSVCTHIFHLSCIEEWARISNTCPLDRAEFDHIQVVESLITGSDTDSGTVEKGPVVRSISVEKRVQSVSDYISHLMTVSDTATSSSRRRTARISEEQCQKCQQNLDNVSDISYCDGCGDAFHNRCLDGALFCEICMEIRRMAGLEQTSPSRRRRRFNPYARPPGSSIITPIHSMTTASIYSDDEDLSSNSPASTRHRAIQRLRRQLLRDVHAQLSQSADYSGTSYIDPTTHDLSRIVRRHQNHNRSTRPVVAGGSTSVSEVLMQDYNESKGRRETAKRQSTIASVSSGSRSESLRSKPLDDVEKAWAIFDSLQDGQEQKSSKQRNTRLTPSKKTKR